MGIDGDEDGEFLLDDYESDTEGPSAKKTIDGSNDYSLEVKELMMK